MNLLFIGGDMRYAKIIKDLKDNNNIYTVGYDNTIFENVEEFNFKKNNINKIDMIILPITGIKDDYSVDCSFSNDIVKVPQNIFSKCKKNTVIFTGKTNKTLEDMIKMSNNNIILNNFFDDKDIIKANSLLTVEGIIDNLISNRGEKSIYGSNIVVLGYGNIGKPLVYVLNQLGANISVGIKEFEDYYDITKNNIICFETEFHKYLLKNIINADFIINTVPEHVIPRKIIDCIKDDCYILDIASPPYGFNKKDVKDKKYYVYSKIPSKYSPVSAGAILEDRMKNVSGGNL